VGSVHLRRLPRMADFALWATACETGLWAAGTFTRAYAVNRNAAIEGIIDADPIAACAREFMSGRPSWTGTPSPHARRPMPAPGRCAIRVSASPTVCSPHGAQRNAGRSCRGALIPDCASLHPGSAGSHDGS
jgi:hypothetical protein